MWLKTQNHVVLRCVRCSSKAHPPASFQWTSHKVVGCSLYGSRPSEPKTDAPNLVGIGTPSTSFNMSQAVAQCRIDATIFRPTPRATIEDSSLKTFFARGLGVVWEPVA